MKKKNYIISLFTIIILFMCSGFVFAEDGNSSINLGNEIMQSVDKTGDSINNVISGNSIKDAGNSMKNGVNSVMDGMENETRNNISGVVNRDTNGDYNVTRVQTEGNGENMNTMSTTTWMWIILVVAAVVIIAAIWYYVTENNS